MHWRSETGKAAEKRGRTAEWKAVALLLCKGYRLIGRRVKTRMGEIDLIVQSPSGIVCFIEVKARLDAVQAGEAVSQRQRGRIVRAAQAFLAGRPAQSRFDIVTVLPGKLPRHQKDAWRPDDIH